MLSGQRKAIYHLNEAVSVLSKDAEFDPSTGDYSWRCKSSSSSSSSSSTTVALAVTTGSRDTAELAAKTAEDKRRRVDDVLTRLSAST